MDFCLILNGFSTDFSSMLVHRCSRFLCNFRVLCASDVYIIALILLSRLLVVLSPCWSAALLLSSWRGGGVRSVAALLA